MGAPVCAIYGKILMFEVRKYVQQLECHDRKIYLCARGFLYVSLTMWKKYYTCNVVLFDLENFYTGLVDTAPNNDSIGVRWE